MTFRPSTTPTEIGDPGQIPPENWAYSSSEEHWADEDGFASREEAEAAAREEFAGNDVERFWTGTVQPVTDKMLAEHALNPEGVVDSIEEHLYELLGDSDVDTSLKATQEQTDELERELTAVIAAWLTKHSIAPRCFTVENVREHEMDDELLVEGATPA